MDILVYHFQRVIRRAIIHDDKLPISESLGDNRIQRLADIGSFIVEGDYDDESWFYHINFNCFAISCFIFVRGRE